MNANLLTLLLGAVGVLLLLKKKEEKSAEEINRDAEKKINEVQKEIEKTNTSLKEEELKREELKTELKDKTINDALSQKDLASFFNDDRR